MYEDLESILVQEGVEDVSMAGPSGARPLEPSCLCTIISL